MKSRVRGTGLVVLSVILLSTISGLSMVAADNPLVEGGGWLYDTEGYKVNFNLSVKGAGSSFNGHVIVHHHATHDKLNGRDLDTVLVFTSPTEPSVLVATIEGYGVIRYRNGTSDDCDFLITLTDRGEPGRGMDEIRIVIWIGGNLVYESEGRIGGGNVQITHPTVKICPNCGSENSWEADICVVCGAYI